jgi:hypothetical protein
MQFTITKADAGQRRSFVVAMDAQGVLPCTFPVAGTTNGYLFTLWFALVLLPAVAARHPGGCNIILDNASIHMPALLLWLVASFYANIFLIFLPPYSPELNPVRARAAGAARARAARRRRAQRLTRTRAHALTHSRTQQIELLFSWVKFALRRRTGITSATLVAAVHASACVRRAARARAATAARADTQTPSARFSLLLPRRSLRLAAAWLCGQLGGALRLRVRTRRARASLCRVRKTYSSVRSCAAAASAVPLPFRSSSSGARALPSPSSSSLSSADPKPVAARASSASRRPRSSVSGEEASVYAYSSSSPPPLAGHAARGGLPRASLIHAGGSAL